MTNYVIMKSKNGEIVRSERKKFTSSKPYFTEEDNCLTKLLDAKKLDELFASLSQKVERSISDSIKNILIDEKIKRDLLKLIEEIKSFDVESKTKSLLDFIEYEKYQVMNRLKHNANLVKEADNENNYLKRINSSLEVLKEKLSDYTNEEGRTTEAIINSIVNQNLQSNISDVKRLIESAASNPEYPNFINSIYNQLLEVTSKEDLKNLYDRLVAMRMFSQIGVSRRNSLSELYRYNQDLALSVMSKEIVKTYMKNLLSKAKMRDLYDMEIDINKGKSPEEILLSIDPTLSDITNDELATYTTKLFADTVAKKLDRESGVLCFSCTNGYTSRCKKIADLEKESIENYPFIIRGYQVYRDERLDRFIVSECANFDTVPHYTRIDNETFKKVRANLSNLYDDRQKGVDPITKALSKAPKHKRIS